MNHSTPSEFSKAVEKNIVPLPDDMSVIAGTEMADIEAMQEARKRSIGSLRDQPRIRGPRKMQSDQRKETTFPLLSKNERKAP